MPSLQHWVSIAAVLLANWAAPLPAGAMYLPGHTYTVNSTLDEPDAAPSNGACDSAPSGLCTLRAAIMAANFDAVADTILVPAGIYTLTRVGVDDQALVGDLDISSDLTVQGAGAGSTIVDGNGALTGDRVFDVLTTTQVVTLSGLTIRHGQALYSGSVYGRLGGGIAAATEDAGSHITLDDTILSGNTADYGGGLGGTAYSQSLILVDSQVVSNTASLSGGGLFLYNTGFSMRRAQIAGNTAGQSGGGLWTSDSWSEANVVSDTTFYGNIAGQDGGGLFSQMPNSSALTLANSTLSDNRAGEAGGGLYDDGGQVRLLSDTIAGNRVAYLSAIQPGLGGGLYLTDTVLLTARNSIVANNLRHSDKGYSAGDDCSSNDTTGALEHNLFTTLAYCLVNPYEYIYNTVGPDPLLGPLQNNGGRTLTRALLPGSPAIDAGDPAGCTGFQAGPLTADQRGAPRADGHCDMGAYERVPEADLAISQHSLPAGARVGLPFTYTLSVNNAGPQSAAAVHLTDSLPLNGIFRSVSTSQGNCAKAESIQCDLGSLAAGARVTLTVAAVPTQAGALINQIQVLDGVLFDPVLANNTASENVIVAWELFLPLVRGRP